MELRDLIVTPLVVVLVLSVAYSARPYVTDLNTYKFFFPALILKIIGAIALGFIYQFYYHGGDTFNFHTHGSRIIWTAFTEDFFTGLKLLFSNGEFVPGAYKYIVQIPFYQDSPSFMVIRFATFFDLLTFSSYSGTAIFFALISFSGSWAMFITFYKKYPHLKSQLAMAILFIPSVIFWGSGILKDTLVLAALGFAVYCMDRIFVEHKVSISVFILLLCSLCLIFSIKKFVLQSFVPSAILWIYFRQFIRIRSTVLKIITTPAIITLFLFSSYYSIIKVGEGDTRYAVENLAKTAQTTAEDIGFLTGGNAGSTYILGNLDGSFSTMLLLAPQAINVSLFRPYVWEVKNPLMLLSALEGLVLLLFTLGILLRGGFSVVDSFSDPDIMFCFVFSISFAFAVGISTFNFGTLARYKIPLLPFYLIFLFLMADKEQERRAPNE